MVIFAIFCHEWKLMLLHTYVRIDFIEKMNLLTEWKEKYIALILSNSSPLAYIQSNRWPQKKITMKLFFFTNQFHKWTTVWFVYYFKYVTTILDSNKMQIKNGFISFVTVNSIRYKHMQCASHTQCTRVQNAFYKHFNVYLCAKICQNIFDNHL